MPTLETLSQRLSDSGLMSAEDVRGFVESVPPHQRPRDGEELVSLLVQKRRLTPYQAGNLIIGQLDGLVIGNYVVMDRLGSGGMGQVFKAEHRHMKRTVAIKVLPEELARDAAFVSRFQREVEAAAKLMHPNIVTAFDADKIEGKFFLAMEYVPGRDLASTIDRDGPLSVPQTISCVLDAARGLEYAHSQGVIHRDVKPANLLWTMQAESSITGTQARGRVVKVLDMGLARLDEESLDVRTQAELTGTGIIMGTVDYMSPEQAQHTKHADHRSDIYSLGITIYSLLTGKPAYPGDSIVARLMSHRDSPIPALRDAAPDVPEGLDALFRRMVAKRPEDRLQSMTDVVKALEAIQAGRPVPEFSVGIPRGVTISHTAPTRRISRREAEVEAIPSPSSTFGTDSNTLVTAPDRSGGSQFRWARFWSAITGAGLLLLALGYILPTWNAREPNSLPRPNSLVETATEPPVQPSTTAGHDDHQLGSATSALLFDGADDFVDTTFLYMDSHPMTFEAWITPACDQSGLKQEVFSNAETAGISFFLRKSHPTFMLHTGLDYISNISWSPVPCGQKSHIAAVFDGISTSIYINGVLQGFKVPIRRSHRPSPLPIYLGANPDPQLQGRPTATIRDPYSGVFHQFRITRAARYNENFEPAAILDSDAETALLYHFTEGSGSRVADLSGNGHDGKIDGATWVTAEQLPRRTTRTLAMTPRPSLRFSGSNSRVEVPDLGINLREPFTVEAWCRPEAPTDPSQNARIIAQLGPFDLRIQNGTQWKFAALSPEKPWKEGVFSPQSLSFGLTHLAGQWNGERLSLYLDGKLAPWPFQTNESPRPPHELIQEILQSAAPGTLSIGGSRSHGSFGGLIYSVRISRGARYSASFEPGELIVDEHTEALYDVSEGIGETLHDRSGHGHHGKVIGAVWVDPVDSGEPYYALSFDGSSRAEVPFFDVLPEEECTLECWIKLESDYADVPDSPQGVGHIFGWQNFHGSKLLVYQEGIGVKSLLRDPSRSALVTRNAVSTSRAIGSWEHIAATISKHGCEFFQAGQLVRIVSHPPPLEYVFPGQGPLTDKAGGPFIGGYVNLGNRDTSRDADGFRGLIRQARISAGRRYRDNFEPEWELAADEQTSALYTCSEGVGTVLKDSSGHGHDGVVRGAQWVRVTRPSH